MFRASLVRLQTRMSDKIAKTDLEWQKQLSAQEFQVLRLQATERPGTHEYNKHYPKSGFYACKGCDLPLYSFRAKFDSGCGWPAYNACYHSDEMGGCHLEWIDDKSHGMTRTEMHCKRCGGHMGHVFYGEKGGDSERHCVNGVSVKYVDGPEPDNVRTGPMKSS